MVAPTRHASEEVSSFQMGRIYSMMSLGRGGKVPKVDSPGKLDTFMHNSPSKAKINENLIFLWGAKPTAWNHGSTI